MGRAECMDYQVLQVKPADLETALNEMAQRGWEVQSIVAAEFSGRQLFGRQSLDVDQYHVVFRRESRGAERR